MDVSRLRLKYANGGRRENGRKIQSAKIGHFHPVLNYNMDKKFCKLCSNIHITTQLAGAMVVDSWWGGSGGGGG